MHTRTSPHTSLAAIISCICLVFTWPSALAISFSLDAASPTGAPTDDILTAGPFPVLPGGGSGFDVNGISYGHSHTSFASVSGFAFSVDRVSGGIPGTATFVESSGGLGEQSADVYAATIAAPLFNTLLFDGNGASPPGAGTAPIGLGLIEMIGGLPTDNLNALDLRLPPPIGGSIYWTSDSLTLPGFSADIFITAAAPGYTAFPPAYVTAAGLGLSAADDIDALVVFDDGDGIYGAADTILFSLAPGSPSLPGLSAGPGDILIASGGGPVSAVPFALAGSLGLTPGDNVNALDVFIVPEPSSLFLLGFGITCLMMSHRRWQPC
ncbi:MAG: PEP-CTERM sorting domain-containing protein [Akkermansiaceae bacterium]|nr:PEP-CTERM sorting domain-containing protein [Akkermansiaceae bacterium]